MFGVEPVERTEGNLGHYLGDMHVGHGSGDAGMSHLFFEREQVKPLFQMMSGKTVTTGLIIPYENSTVNPRRPS